MDYMIEEKEKKTVVKKIDLLRFQQDLNSQFLEIHEAKKSQVKSSESVASDLLGLLTETSDLKFFIPLKALKSITINNNLESIVMTKSWIAGFSQEHGEIYIIFHFLKSVDLILNGVSDFKKAQQSNNSRVVYMKDITGGFKGGLVLDNLKLEYTAEFTKLMISKIENEKISWQVADEVDLSTFIRKDKINKVEALVLDELQKRIALKKQDLLGDFTLAKGGVSLLSLLIGDVYLDAYGEHPIFSLNLENLTKYLSSVSPY